MALVSFGYGTLFNTQQVESVSASLSSLDGRPLVDLDPIVKILRATLVSDYILGGKPLSVLLITPPGTGKTDLIRCFEKVAGVVKFAPGSSGLGILKALIKRVDRKEPTRYMVMDDLIPSLSRKKIAEQFTSVLLSLLDNGTVRPESYDFTSSVPQLDEPLRVGMIAGITKDYLFRKYGKLVWDAEKKKMVWQGDNEPVVRKEFVRSGWLERILPVSFAYEQSIIEKIKEGLWKVFVGKLPEMEIFVSDHTYDVSMTKEQFDQVDSISGILSRETESNSIRYAGMLVKLVKSFALLRVFKEGTEEEPISVNQSDMNDFVSVGNYLGFKMLPLRKELFDEDMLGLVK